MSLFDKIDKCTTREEFLSIADKEIVKIEPTVEILNYMDSLTDTAIKTLLENNGPSTYRLTLVKGFYQYAGKEWWKDYISRHDNVEVIFVDTETNKEYKLYSDGEIYLYNIFEVK